MKEHHTFVRPRFVAGILRFGFNIALAAVLLSAWGNAQAQYNPPTPKTGSVSVTSYGNTPTYPITLGNAVAGTLWDVTYTVTNNTIYPLRFTQATTGFFVLTAGLTLASGSPPSDITIDPGQSFTIAFQAGVPAGGAAVNNTRATVTYNVERVYDMVWRDGDFDEACAPLNTSSLLYASGNGTTSGGNDLNSIIPGCVFGADTAFYNDLSVPVKITYVGFSADGTIAPYIFGTLCGINGAGNSPFYYEPVAACAPSENWPSGGITLQPGETSSPFGMMIGMPYWVGNASMNTSGTYAFQWNITPLGITAPPPPPAASSVPTMDAWALDLSALSLLTLGMMGVSTRRIRRRT